MRNLRILLPALLIGLCLGAPAVEATDDAATSALHTLFKNSWERGMRENPLYASDLGDRRYNNQWPDLSLAALKRYHAEDQADYAALLKINRAELSAQDKVSYDLFKWQHEDGEESWKFHEYLFPLNQLGGIQTVGDYAQSLRFKTLKDYQDWLKRMQDFAPYMDQTIALLQQGVDQGYTLPKVVAERIPQQIKANIVSDPAESVFYTPFKHMPDSIDAATAKTLQAEARKAISAVVVPAFKRLDVLFNTTYLPHARTKLAATSLPDGKAYYAYLVRHFTTTDMTPEQVHKLGLKRVAEIHQQMLDIIKEVKFKGSFADFLHYLRTDPKFYYKNPDALLEAYKAEAKTIDPLLVTEFHKLPRIPWGIKIIPADQAPNTYPAYSYPPAADGSRAAYMYVNLYKPETRPKFEIPVLTCHEGRPGHALQLSLATELTGLPNFRRFGYYNAYGEGWALYTEVLCKEMGLYDTPYKQFGGLSYQSWRAVRLVVDTGIHYYGWSRQKAVDYMKANTALTDQNINTEVDRYIAWPGQALSYMIGELTILKLRDEAKHTLGDKFDIKAFNDEILSNGTLPMSALEKEVREWMAEQAKAGNAH
ncbi:MAG TPA: DUF885 domain-containing protein [Gammaproteobacteria bacterium]|nr:DUF885 domain-containing protein [Gammaproteobacteria bacterium]